jgi:hypothetical protein
VEYVLGYFGTTAGQAKKLYLNFMEERISQGRREELMTSGTLIRIRDASLVSRGMFLTDPVASQKFNMINHVLRRKHGRQHS